MAPVPSAQMVDPLPNGLPAYELPLWVSFQGKRNRVDSFPPRGKIHTRFGFFMARAESASLGIVYSGLLFDRVGRPG